MRSLAAVALVCAALAAGGCAAKAPEPPVAGAASSAAPTPAGPADVRTVAITVTGRQVSPPPAVVTVSQGQTLRLVVTSDHDDELHAHGFEVEKQLVAGTPLTVDLTGAAPGRYEVETHHPALRLLVVQVR